VPVEKTKVFGCSVNGRQKRLCCRRTKGWDKEPVTIEDLKIEDLKGILANNTTDYNSSTLGNLVRTCVSEFPEFMAMHHMYRNREFELITISMDDMPRKQNALNFLKKKKASTKNYNSRWRQV